MALTLPNGCPGRRRSVNRMNRRRPRPGGVPFLAVRSSLRAALIIGGGIGLASCGSSDRPIQLAAADIRIAASPTEICFGDAVTLTGTGCPAFDSPSDSPSWQVRFSTRPFEEGQQLITEAVVVKPFGARDPSILIDGDLMDRLGINEIDTFRLAATPREEWKFTHTFRTFSNSGSLPNNSTYVGKFVLYAVCTTGYPADGTVSYPPIVITTVALVANWRVAHRL